MVDMENQSESELDSPSTRLPPLHPLPCVREGPAPPARPSLSMPSGKCSPPNLPTASPPVPLVGPCGELANIPLHHAHNPHSVLTPAIASAIRTLLICIDICVVMITMHIATTEASGGHSSQRKRL